MANLTTNRKQSKHFEVTIPFTEKGQFLTELTVCGVGYCFPNEHPGEMYDLDIDEVFYKDKKTDTIVQIPISVVEAISGGYSINEIDHIYEPCLEHMQYLFSPDYDKEKDAMDFLGINDLLDELTIKTDAA